MIITHSAYGGQVVPAHNELLLVMSAAAVT
jgi:hypothetical protein